MKQMLIRLLMTMDAMTGGAVAQIAPEPTSEKLDALNQAYDVAWSEMLKFPDRNSKEAKDAKLVVWKLDGEIAAEKVAIAKLAKDAEIAEQRNKRLALNETQLVAHANYLKLHGTKTAKPEDVQAALDAFTAAKEIVNNELLAKYAASTSAKKSVATNGEAKPTDGQKDAIIELFLAGKSHKDIEAAGYARSTVWHTINNYKKANATA